MSKADALEDLCNCMIQISTATEGRLTDWRGLNASLVFAKLCATCISFLRLIPSSTFYTPAKNLQLWDLSSAASLCRNLVEAYYVLVYLKTAPTDEEDADFQQALWEYHAAFERYDMLRSILPDSRRLPELAATMTKCRAKLQESPQFLQLSSGHQKKILAGKKFKLPSNVELSQVARISENYYRGRYKYCSTFAHSAPFSISQLNSFRAGTPDSERVLSALIGTATGYTALAIRDFVHLFPDQESTLRPEVSDRILIWEETLKWEEAPWFDTPKAE
jgi:hypothetical protein